MSLIVALKDKDRVILGADKQASTTNGCDHSATKIWELNELPNIIMGSVGSMRASQILQYNQLIDLNDFPFDGLDTGYIINSIVPNIVATLSNNGVNCTVVDGANGETSTMIPNVIFFACFDRAWMIWNDLSVTELQDYLAIGSGSDVAMGALFATKKADPFERIVTCINAAAETTLFVDHGVDILATTYFEEDEPQIKKALGIEEEKPPEKKSASKKSKAKNKKSTKKKNKADTTKTEENNENNN